MRDTVVRRIKDELIRDPFTQTCKCRPTNKNLSTTAQYVHRMLSGGPAGRRRWMIGTNSERESRTSVIATVMAGP